MDHHRRLQRQLPDPAAALHGDPAAGARILQHALCPGISGQFLGRDQLLAVETAVVDPAVGVARTEQAGSTIGSR